MSRLCRKAAAPIQSVCGCERMFVCVCVHMQLLSALVELARTCPADDPDSLGRSLTALSLLLHRDRDLRQVARDLGTPVSVDEGMHGHTHTHTHKHTHTHLRHR